MMKVKTQSCGLKFMKYEISCIKINKKKTRVDSIFT